MAKPKIQIPIVTHDGKRVVPHYTGCADPGEALMVMYCGEARTPYAHNPDEKAEPTEWVAEPKWAGELRAVSTFGGRSAAGYVVEIETGDGLPPVRGHMSYSTFFDVLERLVNGRVVGTWTARKQGQNYMIRGA